MFAEVISSFVVLLLFSVEMLCLWLFSHGKYIVFCSTGHCSGYDSVISVVLICSLQCSNAGCKSIYHSHKKHMTPVVLDFFFSSYMHVLLNYFYFKILHKTVLMCTKKLIEQNRRIFSTCVKLSYYCFLCVLWNLAVSSACL